MWARSQLRSGVYFRDFFYCENLLFSTDRDLDFMFCCSTILCIALRWTFFRSNIFWLSHQLSHGMTYIHLVFLMFTLLLVSSSVNVADTVFLVDESCRIGSNNFQLIRPFLFKILDALDIGPSNAIVGLVPYSNELRLEFTLGTFKGRLEILNYLKNSRRRQQEKTKSTAHCCGGHWWPVLGW